MLCPCPFNGLFPGQLETRLTTFLSPALFLIPHPFGQHFPRGLVGHVPLLWLSFARFVGYFPSLSSTASQHPFAFAARFLLCRVDKIIKMHTKHKQIIQMSPAWELKWRGGGLNFLFSTQSWPHFVVTMLR